SGSLWDPPEVPRQTRSASKAQSTPPAIPPNHHQRWSCVCLACPGALLRRGRRLTGFFGGWGSVLALAVRSSVSAASSTQGTESPFSIGSAGAGRTGASLSNGSANSSSAGTIVSAFFAAAGAGPVIGLARRFVSGTFVGAGAKAAAAGFGGGADGAGTEPTFGWGVGLPGTCQILRVRADAGHEGDGVVSGEVVSPRSRP